MLNSIKGFWKIKTVFCRKLDDESFEASVFANPTNISTLDIGVRSLNLFGEF